MTYLKPKARVRLVAAEARHSLVVPHDRELARRPQDIDALDVLPNPRNQTLDDPPNLSSSNPPAGCPLSFGRPARDEAHLEVDLGELRLTILPASLISEAPSELEVLVRHARAYQELLRLLR